MIRYKVAMQRLIIVYALFFCMAFWIAFLLIQVTMQAKIIKALESDCVAYEMRVNNLVQEVNRMQSEMDKIETDNAVSRGKERTVKMLVTAYCPCQLCCDKTDGITASGKKAVEGITIAADKRYPFGTQMYIDGFGWRTVQDRGGAVQGNHVDLYFDRHSDALEFGTRQMEVIVR